MFKKKKSQITKSHESIDNTGRKQKDVKEELFLIFDILYFDFRTPNPVRYFKIYILYLNIF